MPLSSPISLSSVSPFPLVFFSLANLNLSEAANLCSSVIVLLLFTLGLRIPIAVAEAQNVAPCQLPSVCLISEVCSQPCLIHLLAYFWIVVSISAQSLPFSSAEMLIRTSRSSGVSFTGVIIVFMFVCPFVIYLFRNHRVHCKNTLNFYVVVHYCLKQLF